MTRKSATADTAAKQFCSYCDHRGIIINPLYREMGENALLPCPKCIQNTCACGGVDPYYFNDNGVIRECHCRSIRLKIDRIAVRYAQSGIDRKYRWRFINDFQPVSKAAEAAKAAAYDIIMKFPDVRKGLFLWGNPGTGKTLLSAIILTELIARSAIEGRFIKVSRTFFERLRATFREGSESYGEAERIQQELAEADVLVIDDFGVQRDTPWEQETLYNLVDARYEAERFTIFTSNNNPFSALKEFSDGRVLSRIKEMCRIIELAGADFRDKL
ncbi:MAG TPA: ATP-binding protein [Spirochaetota bacterium]|nr:ATP-binding protein [Spirochaetota bacterium]HNT11907.1 ATP-binding protein [Spirochaetota bacterium]HNV48496.1 ATP-binding protein [Spirochaetota bacterium]HOS39239.1 ATP-binding protein [Spirochaetota bacterium]HPU87525.1 ATP-binding protein [Spirochaetota bacterium]